MNHIFNKLNFKGQRRILVLNPPASFRADLNEMLPLTSIDEEIADAHVYEFILAFVEKQDQVKGYASQIKDTSIDDPIVWFAYPKKTSAKYKSDLSRDEGWQPLANINFSPVKQIAIDGDWSALRFRNASYVKRSQK